MVGKSYGAAIAALLLCMSCSESNPEPTLLAVSPDKLPLGQEFLVTLHGENLLADVRLDLSGSEQPTVDKGFEVAIGNVVVSAVSYVDSSELIVVVPPTLELGYHDVQLTAPSGAIMSLSQALEVVPMLPTVDAGPGEGDGGPLEADGGIGIGGPGVRNPAGQP